jgi:hypothetical protein
VSALTPYLPLLLLWCAVCATAVVVIGALGFGCLKKYPLTAAILFLSLASFPVGGVFRAGRPLEKRVMAHLVPLLLREKSVPIQQSGCPMFPPDNIWNRRIQDLPLDTASQAYLSQMGPGDKLHADFGADGGYRFAVTDGTAPVNQMNFLAGEDDPGPYRIPDNAPIEEGGDGHVLTLDRRNCLLYELFAARHDGRGRWSAMNGSIFDLRSNQLRPDGWTSADAAGTAIIPGLARYEEVAAGHIGHALRFTALHTRRAYVWPARHYASTSDDPSRPPMGQRFRLKASVDISPFSRQTQVLLTALKEYGMILADNGGNWYVSGALDSRWDQRIHGEFASLHGTDFEAVNESSLMVNPDSAQARQ